MLIDQIFNQSIGNIKVSKLLVYKTYSWLLSGIPTKEMNRNYIKDIRKRIYKRYKEIPLFLGSKVHILKADSNDYDNDIDENERKEILAPFTCILKLTSSWSNLKSEYGFTESSLWVFWCQEILPWPQNERTSILNLDVTFYNNNVTLNIDEKILTKIKELDWKTVSCSYDNTP